MTLSIPTKEPETLRAGDTWKWRREDLADYPAPTWTLTYRFKSPSSGFEITAAADGTYFDITVAASATAAYPAGEYDYIGRVSSGTEKYTVATGRLTVTPDLAQNEAANPFDTRSHARKVLEAIEAVIEKRATQDQEAYTINGRSLQRTPVAELLALRDRYRLEVTREDDAAALAAGRGDRRRTFVRFGRV